MTTHLSRADGPARYAKQLVSHLGRKLDFTQRGDTATAVVAGTVASITTGDDVLVLQAADTTPTVSPVPSTRSPATSSASEKDELAVTWQRSTT